MIVMRLMTKEYGNGMHIWTQKNKNMATMACFSDIDFTAAIVSFNITVLWKLG